jgi:hypothetical protein
MSATKWARKWVKTAETRDIIANRAALIERRDATSRRTERKGDGERNH